MRIDMRTLNDVRDRIRSSVLSGTQYDLSKIAKVPVSEDKWRVFYIELEDGVPWYVTDTFLEVWNATVDDLIAAEEGAHK